jgi:UDP-2,3-diacylglucosamine pyrophosphatase LpxH
MNYKTVIISDLHLGSTYSRSKDIYKFLSEIKCETLILNGDIIDGWALKRGNSWSGEHMKCVRKIMKKAYKTKVIWVRGNHDDFLYDFIPISLGNIEIVENHELYGLNGKKYLVLHGDIFDIFINEIKWLAKVGSICYDMALWLNKWYNNYRAFMGKEYFSLSQKIKASVKEATNFIGNFENHMVSHSKSLGFDGVICGHIHKAEIRNIDGIEYMNSGDWVESNTALVEDYDGNWSLIHY